MPRKIAVVTGARSEYGLLSHLIKQIHQDPDFTLQLIVTGMHLSPEFGLTYQQILNDGLQIDEKIEMLLSSDTAIGITKSMGLGLIGFADAFDRLKPDLIILLGDRFETLAAAQASLIAKIPLVHIHGGELSLGALDDAMRHSITKMSHLHFVACEAYRQRVIQLGENPDRVFNVGAMMLDAVDDVTMLSRQALTEDLNITFKKRNFLITYHPETGGSGHSHFESLLNALLEFEDALLIFTEANADASGRAINNLIHDFCARYPQAVAFKSLGQKRYLSLLKQVDVVIGNSSSGIIEAPYCHVPTVNIGTRQTGRIKPLSVIDCGSSVSEIITAVEQALSKAHLAQMENMPLPYGKGKVAYQIIDVLKNSDFPQLLHKPFYDLKAS